jgi:outer membrane biosynthesis protein TonB
MSTHTIHWHSWELADAADRQFRRLLVLFSIPVLLFILILPFIDLVGLTRGGGTLAGQQYVELISERPDAAIDEQTAEAAPEEIDEPDPIEPEAEPEPEPVAETPVPPAPTAPPVPRPTVDPVVAQEQAAARAAAEARQRAQEQARVFDQLAGLRQDTLSGLDPAQPLTSSSVVGSAGGSSAGAGAARPERIAESARQSEGIRDPGLGETRRTAQGTGLASRNTTQVESPVGFGEDRTRPGQDGDKPVAGRQINEIQLVFDRNKGAFTAIMNRALRSNPNLRGKITVSFTIRPDGSVTDLVMVNSELGDAEVERQVLTRIQLINFGAKAGIPDFPVKNYPITLL